jgi:type VI secretion system protein ImpC
MSKSTSDRVGFFIEAESSREPRTETSGDEPFRIALLGDFSGAAERKPLTQRRPILVDRDNFDEVLAKLRPSIDVAAGRVEFSDIDDFHPDVLYDRLPVFDALRVTRDRLSDPSTFVETAHDLYGTLEPKPVPVAKPDPSGNLLDQLLAASNAAPARARVQDDLQNFIREAVRPYLVARQDPRAPEMIRQVDEAAAGVMRGIIHDHAFQSMEARWRTVQTLVRRLETGTDLKIYLIDVTKEELSSGMQAVYDLIVHRADSLAVIAGTDPFGASDIPLLRALARIARKAVAPLLVEGDLSVLDENENWAEFRRSPEAQWVGLAMPRILLRLPYGNSTIPCERFAFEEVSGKPDPKTMLWANPAPFCAMLLGQAFELSRWDMRPGAIREIDNLPVYVYKEDGESLALPCAEVELTEDTADALMDIGFMPLVSIRHSDRVRVARFQSVADPVCALPGRWQ